MPDYFTLPELRAFPQVGNRAKYSDERCEAAAAYIVGIIEREVGTAFIERTITDEVHNGGRAAILLDHADATELTSMTVDGVTVAVADLELADGVIRYESGLLIGDGPGEVLVTYKYGYSTTVPDDVKDAALQGTRARLIATGPDAAVDDRRTSMTTDGGTVSFITAGGRDHPTGYPEVDAVIVAWRDRLDVDGFA